MNGTALVLAVWKLRKFEGAMTLLKILTEPAILIITVFFLFFIMTVVRNYAKVQKNLSSVSGFLKTLNKKELSYRFQQLDEFMSAKQLHINRLGGF